MLEFPSEEELKGLHARDGDKRLYTVLGHGGRPPSWALALTVTLFSAPTGSSCADTKYVLRTSASERIPSWFCPQVWGRPRLPYSFWPSLQEMELRENASSWHQPGC